MPCVDGPAAHFPGGADYLVHHLLGLPISDSEPASLVICAIRTGNQLTEGTRAWEPGLQVELLTGSMIQGACKETPRLRKGRRGFRRLSAASLKKLAHHIESPEGKSHSDLITKCPRGEGCDILMKVGNDLN